MLELEHAAMKLKVSAVIPDDGQPVQIIDQAIEPGICVQLKTCNELQKVGSGLILIWA